MTIIEKGESAVVGVSSNPVLTVKDVEEFI